jgi:hypothetical protein
MPAAVPFVDPHALGYFNESDAAVFPASLSALPADVAIAASDALGYFNEAS